MIDTNFEIMNKIVIKNTSSLVLRIKKGPRLIFCDDS